MEGEVFPSLSGDLQNLRIEARGVIRLKKEGKDSQIEGKKLQIWKRVLRKKSQDAGIQRVRDFTANNRSYHRALAKTKKSRRSGRTRKSIRRRSK